METNPLIGTWRFISFEGRAANGTVRPMAGPDARGYLVYTRDGHVLVTLQLRHPANFSSGDMINGTVDELSDAYRSLISYSGTYEIRGDRVIHHVEVSLYPNWIGGDQVRFCTFEGDRLALSTEPVLYEGIEIRAYLIWEPIR